MDMNHACSPISSMVALTPSTAAARTRSRQVISRHVWGLTGPVRRFGDRAQGFNFALQLGGDFRARMASAVAVSSSLISWSTRPRSRSKSFPVAGRSFFRLRQLRFEHPDLRQVWQSRRLPAGHRVVTFRIATACAEFPRDRWRPKSCRHWHESGVAACAWLVRVPASDETPRRSAIWAYVSCSTGMGCPRGDRADRGCQIMVDGRGPRRVVTAGRIQLALSASLF